MDGDIEKDPIFVAQKAICTGVFPELTDKLKSWTEHRKITSKINELLAKMKFEEVGPCMESAKKMDELRPQIAELGMNLTNSLHTLQTTYTKIPNDEMLSLVGIKEQYDSMADDLGVFIAVSSLKKN